MTRIAELGGGLELWKVQPKELKEQPVNARYMPPEMFERLVQNIKKDQRLESLPFCAYVNGEIQIVSGHHRVRAAIQAGLEEIYVIVDVTNLGRDRIKAKQLAHNSIQGQDDPEILRRIFEEIKDADARIEAFVTDEMLKKIATARVEDLNIPMEFREVTLLFVPIEKEEFEEVVKLIEERLVREESEYYLADMKLLGLIRKVSKKISEKYKIKSMGTILWKMAKLAKKALQEGLDDGETEADT